MREEQSNNADYIIDEIEASLLKDENSAFRIGGSSLRMSQVANGSSCSIAQLEKKNSMAKLICPNGNGKLFGRLFEFDQNFVQVMQFWMGHHVSGNVTLVLVMATSYEIR